MVFIRTVFVSSPESVVSDLAWVSRVVGRFVLSSSRFLHSEEHLFLYLRSLGLSGRLRRWATLEVRLGGIYREWCN